ncbi:unnamed protein product [Rotaria sp. Silwood1]|nr:unnamed protein product [Rotaria sp. Silwood1]CAF3869090.1 unnamed protein product [Rotaria sp. Silwood1]CAF4982193.1 unnamed protein product [Rotaria sp. Silwood1]CAF5006491.1 unnamed protein product [Rotaria sp. Silwood1]
MPRNKISDIVKGRILELLYQGYSQRRIVNILKLNEISIARSTVSNVKRKIGRQRNSGSKIKIFRKKSRLATFIVKKVIRKIDVENPPTQRVIAKYLHIAQSSVSNIIKNAGFILRKKRKVQNLTSLHMKRRQRSHGLYRQLANHRHKKFITTDESWFSLDRIRGKRKVCYIKKSDPNYDRMIIQQNTSRPKGFMVWGGISSRGKTNLRFVEPGAKINSDYYINNILQPFLRQDIPRLIPRKERIKWFFHQDSAPSHTSKQTIEYLNKCKINYVNPEEWLPSSPDAAPMDYAIWGY